MVWARTVKIGYAPVDKWGFSINKKGVKEMVDAKEALLRDLSDSIVEMDEEKAVKTARIILNTIMSLMRPLLPGWLMVWVEQNCMKRKEYYIPELLMCSDAYTQAWML